jgi:shikimate 5-dehydrogenase
VTLDALVSPDSILFDIAYDVWPSVNAQHWHDCGGRTISGLSMLTAQALEQVRIFVTGSDETPLPREDEVRLAMNAAVGLDESGLILRSIG